MDVLEGVWIIDACSRITLADRKMAEMFGYSVDEMIGRPLTDFAAVGLRGNLCGMLEKCSKGGRETCDFLFERKGGSPIWASLSISPLTDASGAYSGALAMVSAISEGKRAEELPLDSMERQCRQMAGATGWVSGAIPSARDITDEWEITQEHAKIETVRQASADLLQGTRKRLLNENRNYRKDGSIVCCERYSSGIYDNRGRLSSVCSLVLDTTERRRAEDGLRESEATLRAVLEATKESVFMIGREGTILEINSTAASQFNSTTEKMLGRNIFEFLPPVLATNRMKQVQKVIETGSDVNFDDRRGDIWIENAIHPVLDADGKVNRVVVRGHDITRQKQAITETSRTNELLRSIRDAQSAYIASGDLKSVFHGLLDDLISITDSEYGFLDEVCHDPDGCVYKRNLALSDISWDDGSRLLYEKLKANELVFRNLDNLAGIPALKPEVLIANDPTSHPCYRGLPDGHPAIRSYMGVPLMFGREVVGVAGLANRHAGYDHRLADFLEPFLSTCATLISADKNARREEELNSALIASEEKFRIIANYSIDWENWFDTGGKLLWVNPAVEKITGRTCDECYQMEDFPYPLIHSADRDIWSGKFLSTLKNFLAQSLEIRILFRDGTIRWGEAICQTIFDKDGKTSMGARVSIRDVTERKLAQEALQSAMQYNRSLIEASLDPLVTIDSQGRISDANAATELATGVTRSRLIGTDFSSYFTEPARARWGYETAFQVGFVRDFPLDIRHADGMQMPVLYNASVFRNTKSEVVGIFAAARDITRKKAAEAEALRAKEELERRAEELERSNQELEDFAYIASHDLKEPLRGIHNYSAFLLEDYQDRLEDDGKAKLRALMDLTRRLEALTDDLLHYSRVGQTKLAIQETDIGALVRDVVATMESSLAERGGAVVVAPDMPVVRCDPTRVGEVFRNLIVNGAKYNDRPDKMVEVGWRQMPEHGPGPVFFVKDNGIGIRERHFDKIFKIFKRLHGRDRYGGGTGSGLTIARKIVERHGGQIWVESEVGVGSSFFFSIGKGEGN